MTPDRTHWRYDSIDELMRDATAAPRNAANVGLCNWKAPDAWYCADRGISTHREAMRVMQGEHRFDVGVARLEEMAREIEAPAPVSIKRRLTRGDHGDELDMQRVWAGDIDNAWTRGARRRAVSVSRALVAVFVGGHAKITSYALAWRGVAGLALANTLDQSGYAVEVLAIRRGELIHKSGNQHNDPKNYHDVDVLIKGAGQPLDLHKAASLIASPLLFRSALLAHACAHSRLALDAGVSHTHKDRATLYGATNFDFTCVVGHDVLIRDAAQAWVTKTAEQLRAAEHERE